MTVFKDLYSETETTGTFWVGRGSTRSGQIMASSVHIDDQQNPFPFASFFYDGETGTLRLGDVQLGAPGRIVVGYLSDTAQAILLDGQGGKITLGGHNTGNGTVTLLDQDGEVAATLSGEDATITVGGVSHPGMLFVRSVTRDQQGTEMPWGSLVYDGATAVLKIGDLHYGKAGKVVIGTASADDQAILLDGDGGHVTLGGSNSGDGSLTVKNLFGTPVGVLDAEHATLTLGHATTTQTDQDADGTIVLRSAGGDDTVVLDGKNGNITLGGGGDADGDLTLRTAGGTTAIQLAGSDATMTLGGAGVNGDIFLKNDNDIETIKIFGSIGDIEFLNADLAEEFEVGSAAVEAAVPGTVMVITPDGTLSPCGEGYDSRVVGVVAGAGDHRPGIVMDKSGGPNRVPIALVGKAFCLADASGAPIEVGDLLTTSPRSGHAMKATDRLLAVGSVIGKALSPLPAERGLIPMLVMAR